MFVVPGACVYLMMFWCPPWTHFHALFIAIYNIHYCDMKYANQVVTLPIYVFIVRVSISDYKAKFFKYRYMQYKTKFVIVEL